MNCVGTITIHAVLNTSIKKLSKMIAWRDTYCSVVNEALTRVKFTPRLPINYEHI